MTNIPQNCQGHEKQEKTEIDINQRTLQRHDN